MSTREVLEHYPPERDRLLVMLHAIQRNNAGNNIAPADIRQVAEYLNTTTASVYGVVRYYSMFRVEPRGQYIIRLCKSPLCRMVGAFNLLAYIEQKLSIRMGETTSDMVFTLEPSECLGYCDRAPVMMINERIFVDLDEKKVEQIIDDLLSQETTKRE